MQMQRRLRIKRQVTIKTTVMLMITKLFAFSGMIYCISYVISNISIHMIKR